MRIALALLALGACAAVEPPAASPAPGDMCGARNLSDLIGRSRSDSLEAEVARRTGGRRLRWIRPGDMVTMDYSPERLNIHLDARDRIERVSCG